MIARIWSGRARADTADAYLAHLETAVFPQLRGIAGHQGTRVLRREVEGGFEFLVMTLWESMDAVRQFAGDAADRAVVPPAAQELLAEYDAGVRHFEIVSTSDEEVGIE